MQYLFTTGLSHDGSLLRFWLRELQHFTSRSLCLWFDWLRFCFHDSSSCERAYHLNRNLEARREPIDWDAVKKLKLIYHNVGASRKIGFAYYSNYSHLT